MASGLRALALGFLTLQVVCAGGHDQTQLESYRDGRKTYQIDVPGKDPITIIETDSEGPPPGRWIDVSLDPADKDAVRLKHEVQDRYEDVTVDHSRCLGPSCPERGSEDETQAVTPDRLEEFLLQYADKVHGLGGDAKERLEAIGSLAAKLKRDKSKDGYGSEMDDEKSYPSSWNRLKVKQHKHPYDDRDGWVTMEAVPWATSKVSKWKPNGNRHRPNHWDDDAADDRPTSEEFKRPSNKRPAYINNQPHFTDWNETPSKPSWTQQSASYPSTWSPDEGRRPHKPNCDADSHRYPDSSVYYGMTDSVVTDSRPTNFPYEYQALKRPFQRPTQVVYAGYPEEGSRPSHPTGGEGQWVLLSTTKGYHHSKKRPRSMTAPSDGDSPTMTSHRAVSLTVLPLEGADGNMTTSHGGLLEVERSFKSVEESRKDLEKIEAGSVPKKGRRRLVSAATGADGASVLAAVGAGMVPATMAMVVPMMLGRRRRRDLRAHLAPPPRHYIYE